MNVLMVVIGGQSVGVNADNGSSRVVITISPRAELQVRHRRRRDFHVRTMHDEQSDDEGGGNYDGLSHGRAPLYPFALGLLRASRKRGSFRKFDNSGS